MKYSFILLFLTCSAWKSSAQRIENLQAAFDGQNLIVTYNLSHDDPQQTFDVKLYSSHDNFTTPLYPVTGDVGSNVMPGISRHMTWNPRTTLPTDFDGELTFKVKGTVNLTLTAFEHSRLKRGNSTNVTWKGGIPADKINLELLKDDKVVQQLADKSENNKSFVWSTSKKLKPGQYQVRLTNANDLSEISYRDITIKRRIPLLVKGLLVAGAGVAIWQLTKPEEEADLPAINVKPPN